ncbi:CPBP family intramembrane metalloprotease [Clostridium sp. 'deep sea']|uniref:CPBP family glutamic-type intramembrane protease n=1 Tax=Clostridium sp. 'deep sea' TaxID=2779445 RepID=UPI0018969CD6|nr:CPBP family glutamic-type intramembrane protease [Clostridium sp. 'deep sea']QOR35051.1 CPBP family intramembrane metalloprotease [Clostridium sp. 'deep sea']
MKHKTITLILVFGIVVVLLDLGLAGVVFIKKATLSQSISDFVIVVLAGIVGYLLAKHTDLPIWWRLNKKNQKRNIIVLTVMAVVIVAVNSYVNIAAYIGNKSQLFKAQPPLELLDPLNAVLYSLRSALTEELIFRFLMISILVFMLQYFVKEAKLRRAISIFMASLLFALIHPIFIIPLIVGMLLSYMYVNYGLMPVLAVNFLANVIPFVYIALSK